MNKFRALLTSLPVKAFALALLLGTLSNWTHQFALGYSAGLNDHLVLSLVGLQWSDPTKYVNDWFINASPQPHWFFDLITFVGAETNSISWLYFAYWCCGLIAFGFATMLIATKWAPAQPFIAALAMTAIISQTPWNVVGSGSTMIAQALPTVLAGQLMYLTLALLLTGKWKLVPLFSLLIGIVHVQQGAVIGIILIATFAVIFFASRRLEWRLLLGSALAMSATVFGLMLRPIAANLRDFVEVCETIIPYHCAAHTWGTNGLIAFSGLILLAALTIVYTSGANKIVWLTSVGLSSFGLFIGMALDAFQVPVLGELAQSVNVYRLGVVIIPFAVWGMLIPILTARWSKKYLFIAILWLVGLGSYFLLDGWSVGGNKAKAAIIAIILAVSALVAWLSKKNLGDSTRVEKVRSAGVFVTGLSFLFASALAGSIIVRPLNIEFLPNKALQSWGSEVEQIVPSGEVILAPPLASALRLSTSRAVIADCKTVPYGGDAWQEWKKRIERLGGVDQCINPLLSNFSDFNATQLSDIAAEYGAHYMILDPQHFADYKTELTQQGWEVKLEPTTGISAILLGHK